MANRGGQPSAVGSRLYKTGDRARYLPNGAIEYLGRLDFQVKLRGYRIELGEIEVALQSHPAVREAAVVVREAEAGDKQLVAYVVPAAKQTMAVGELRAWLGARLPEYMVPGRFVVLEAMPLTTSGKLNRQALPAADEARVERVREYVAPETALEQKLAAIWAAALGVQHVGLNDHFFELGGYSLLVPQVIYQINQAFQVKLTARELFEEPTLERLALLIEEKIIEEMEAVES